MMADNNSNPAYWPGQDNECHEVKGCGGAGTPEHIDHVLRSLPLVTLVGRMLAHCGDRGLSQHMSCMCCHYAREIGRRGGCRE
jgi:hypothetical protein